ncbi:copper homeostasis protein CutC [Tahibacter soli]|uniref:PF03932 family protein CutC n=1 Tax=Tahibacter soli TaxID=2983605 RepID=A0A9X4BGE9_9GAMM|nr:copper homeostasis protein CutC [Tahibacter soli]MDC8012690.1 copper homeostasis protein CutC [Tahibacter soli]
MSERRILEIAANSLTSALAAQAGGADRIELCENLGEGGTTPSYGTIALARERLTIAVYVLIRPRGGDFVYDGDEREAMRRDVAMCRQLRCDGVVLGALDVDGDVDIDTCRALIDEAGTMGVTFHRAFDAARDPVAALERIVDLRCERVLTSGGQPTALAGADAIAAYARQSAGRMRIMAGAGVNAAILPELIRRGGVNEVHASARRLRASPATNRAGLLPGLEPDYMATDVDEVRALRAALDGSTTK